MANRTKNKMQEIKTAPAQQDVWSSKLKEDLSDSRLRSAAEISMCFNRFILRGSTAVSAATAATKHKWLQTVTKQSSNKHGSPHPEIIIVMDSSRLSIEVTASYNNIYRKSSQLKPRNTCKLTGQPFCHFPLDSVTHDGTVVV